MQVASRTPSPDAQLYPIFRIDLTANVQRSIAPPDDAFAHARFYGFHDAPRPNPLARVAIGGEPATAQLDRTVQRLRARDELLLTEVVEDRGDAPFFRALTIVTPAAALLWIAIGVLIAWAEGRL